MVAIIDYGVCNVGSIKNMLKKIGAEDVRVINSPKDFASASHLILPGVGSFDSGMASLDTLGLTEAIRKHANSGRPLLGVCLGMQLLGRSSEEGNSKGLSLIPMECRRFLFGRSDGKDGLLRLKVPHMGWDRVDFANSSRLLDGIESPQRFYFVHSYHAVVDDDAYELMSCDYGGRFVAAVQKDNIYGCQFHPEKSHQFGMRLLKNFVEKC